MHCSRRLTVQTLVFSPSYLHRQVSPPETLVVKGGTTWGREMAGNFDRKLRLPRIHFRVLLHFANMRHGTNGFTSLPKEGVLRIFLALKNPRAAAGFEPANLGTEGQHATSRPPKLLGSYRIGANALAVSNTVYRFYRVLSSCCWIARCDKDAFRDKLKETSCITID